MSERVGVVSRGPHDAFVARGVVGNRYRYRGTNRLGWRAKMHRFCVHQRAREARPGALPLACLNQHDGCSNAGPDTIGHVA